MKKKKPPSKPAQFNDHRSRSPARIYLCSLEPASKVGAAGLHDLAVDKKRPKRWEDWKRGSEPFVKVPARRCPTPEGSSLSSPKKGFPSAGKSGLYQNTRFFGSLSAAALPLLCKVVRGRERNLFSKLV